MWMSKYILPDSTLHTRAYMPTIEKSAIRINSTKNTWQNFLFMIQLSEHWKKNPMEISCLPWKPYMLKKTSLLNCEIHNGKIFLTAGIMNGSFVPCLLILIWFLGRITSRNSRLRKSRIYKFPCFHTFQKEVLYKKAQEVYSNLHISYIFLCHRIDSFQTWLIDF